jgi:hypothetical protein
MKSGVSAGGLPWNLQEIPPGSRSWRGLRHRFHQENWWFHEISWDLNKNHIATWWFKKGKLVRNGKLTNKHGDWARKTCGLLGF